METPDMNIRLKALCASLAALPMIASAALPAYAPVTDARLTKPEAANWLMYRGNYEGWGYSPLKQINSQNVGKLVPAWSYATGMTEGHQAPAHGQQRLHVRDHPQQPGDRPGGGHRQGAVALQEDHPPTS
jgi:glucose dehydrogenase